MPTDIDILKKAFLKATSTSDTVQPWDEPLARRETPVRGAPGELGSWGHSISLGYYSVDPSVAAYEYRQRGTFFPDKTTHETIPGTPGYNNVDFVPYNWNTNRFGNKGGALLGHPISWEVVGPTLKSPYCHWIWEVNFGGNQVTMVNGPQSLALTGAGTPPDFSDAYGLSQLAPAGIADLNEQGGLYALVTFTGDVFDNTILDRVAAPNVHGPITPNTGTDTNNILKAPFELFRVSSFAGRVVTLKSSKLLSTYFSPPVGPIPAIRSLTFIRPKLTRLAAFPLASGGAQANRVYVFLPPAKSALSEYMPPFVGGGTCPDWSVNGGFDEAGTIPTGVLGDYGTPVNLPNLTKRLIFSATVKTTPPAFANRWEITTSFHAPINAGKVIRIQGLNQTDTTPADSVFGYFEVDKVAGVGPYTVTLKRVPEVNSDTGAVFYGNGPTSATANSVQCELAGSIQEFFEDTSLNVHELAKARLDNLIPPNLSNTTTKDFFSTFVTGANPFPAAKPDRAIFDTRSLASDPGNLMDLGFRVVLFPAMKGASTGQLVPDFDHPIDSNNVVLDPTINEKQSIEIDYVGGVLYLSHTPRPGFGCDIAPNGIQTDAENPRKEIVLYAACVPSSREPSQVAGGLRVLTGTPSNVGFGSGDMADVYGQRVVRNISGTPTIALGGSVVLTAGEDLPASGIFRLMELGGGGTFVSEVGPCYYSKYVPGTNTVSGISFPTGSIPYVTTANTRLVMVKNFTRSDYAHDSDATRGSSKRVNALGVKGAGISFGVDGSVILNAAASSLDDAYRIGNAATPGAGRIITVDGGAVEARLSSTTATTDPMAALFRANGNTYPTNPTLVAGFDFISPGDAFAGFSDRRVVAPGTGSTVLGSTFNITITGTSSLQVTTGGNKFWTSGPPKKTLLSFGHDLIEISVPGFNNVYVIQGYGSIQQEVVVQSRDLPGFSVFNGVGQPPIGATGTATVYRSSLRSGPSLGSAVTWGMNTWASAFGTLNESAIVGGIPGAINLYAGSSLTTVQDAGSKLIVPSSDGGGSSVALAFWTKYTDGTVDETIVSPTRFDTFGRLSTTLTGAIMAGDALTDYRFRGDFISRSVKDTSTPTTVSSVGHIVEDFAYVNNRFDFLSLLPVKVYTFTVSFTATPGVLTVTDGSPQDINLIPFGAAMVEIRSTGAVSPAGSLGLYRLESWTSGPNTLYVKTLAGATPSGAAWPANADTGTIRLYLYASTGRKLAASYLSSLSPATIGTHTPTQTVGVGIDTTAVGVHIAGPARIEPGAPGGTDRHAYRVTTSKNSLNDSTKPAAVEVAALDLDGNHKALDYLYHESTTITKLLDPTLFQGSNTTAATFTVSWGLIDALAQGKLVWESNGFLKPLDIPISLPRSGTRLDASGNRTHRTRFTSFVVMGTFHGAGATLASVSLVQRTLTTGSPPVDTVTALYLNDGATTATSLGIPAGNLSNPYTVWSDAGATVPVYIDDTTTSHYFIRIISNNAGVSNDTLQGIQVTYTDPGPRNF